MRLTAKEIAVYLNGTVVGDDQSIITHPDKIEQATEGAITFLSNLKYESYIYQTKATAVLVQEDFIPTNPLNLILIKVKDVYSAITQFLQFYEQAVHPQPAISSMAIIAPTAKLGTQLTIGDFTVISKEAIIEDGSRIYPQVFIGANVRIGKNVIIYPGVKIYHNCQIGDNCIIQANAVIGSDGFGFAPQADGTYEKIPQVGIVILEDNVEIGANTVIDRATMGQTVIKKGTKLDNLIQIAHNVTIGENTVIAAQTGIAGSTKIGNQCQFGGQVGIVGHIEIANGVKIQAQSGVAASIKKEGSKVYGYPALPYQDYLRSYALFRQLPQLEKRIRELEKNKK